MNELIDALKECVKKGDFTLASGKKSRYYIDIKKASTNPAVLKLVAHSIADILTAHSIPADIIGGVALGGVPIAVAVSLETSLPLLIIRKESKDYGTKGQIEGDVNKGKTVVLVEDVTTTGGSVLNAITTLRREGLIVKDVIAVVDREEGALHHLARANVKLTPLITISELLNE